MENKWLNEAFKGEVPSGFQGKVGWASPSNIALVKYWGKRGKQLPQNPSISFTLSECCTETFVEFEKADRFGFKFFFEGKENPAFGAKIEKFLLENQAFFPFINQLNLKVESRNTFPHSSGIASSASSMSAFVMGLLDIESKLVGPSTGSGTLAKASYFSRLASGSAARSVFPKMALWGATPYYKGSSDEYAVSLTDDIHPVFKTYRDSILIVSGETKSVSSRAGHALMEGNPYAPARYAQANTNIKNLLTALKSGDLNTFINITESEALQLHALMMCSNPSYILMKPNTLRIIEIIRQFRDETKTPLCFTLDAGPNVHLLYPDSEAAKVEHFIQDVLTNYCDQGRWIADRVGNGPKKMLQ
jgi:diphosphomevalonate decarboxylase